MASNDNRILSLFEWQPECKLIPYPLVNRIGKIRNVAGKLLDKPTEKSADHYRTVVTEALELSLAKIGLSDAAIDEEIGRFWLAVSREIVRRSYGCDGDHPTGGAA
jgi:hypothetical protein